MIYQKPGQIGQNLSVKTRSGRNGTLCGWVYGFAYVSFSPDESPDKFRKEDLYWADDSE